jgi:acyl-CoA synthetase (AMP-forming)/AMP-acid ligase II
MSSAMTTRVGIDVPDVGYRPTLGESIRRAAREFGDADFIVMPDRRMTFAEAESRSRQVAKRMLVAGIGKGTRVGLAFTYGPEFVVAWLAALRIGALVMPFSTIYKPAELRQVLRIGDVHTLIAPSTLLGRDFHGYLEAAIPGLADSGPSPAFVPEVPYLRAVWIDGESDRAWATPVSLDGSDVVTEVPDEVLARVEEEVVPADLAQVVYTSGSSALPKGVVHSHAAIVRTTAEFGDLLRSNATTPILCGFPFFWIGGTLVLGAALHGGIALCCLERFEPEAALDLVEKERAKSVAAWPSLIQSMKSHPSFAGRDLSSCPMLVEGPSDVALLGSPVPGIPRHRGMSETVGNWNGVARRVVDPETGADVPDMVEGELVIRGHGLMLGYYKKEREEVFDADGWLHTGDRVFMHENQPWFVGRYYEMIKSQGANVSPREVELMLEGLPGVQHALVMAFPHPEMEEEVGVVIVPAPGTTVDPAELEKLARAELSSYKVPTRWIVIDDESQIPWLASGKPDKLQLRRMLVEEAP